MVKEYEYIDDIAEELQVDSQGLRELIERLGITIQQTGVPPSAVDTSSAVSHRDAEHLRRYCAEHPAAAARGG